MIGLHVIFESEWIVHRTECRLKSMHLWLATDYKIWFLGYDIKVNELKMSKWWCYPEKCRTQGLGLSRFIAAPSQLY